MAAIDRWFIGRDNLAIAATPQDVAADGTLSDNVLGAITFSARLDDSPLNAETAYVEESIVPLDSGYENDVDLMIGTTYTISEVMKAATSSTAANSLDKIARTSRYVKLVITWKNPAGTTVRTETAYVKWSRYNPSYRKGKTIGQMVLKTVAVTNAGAYIANPAMADS